MSPPSRGMHDPDIGALVRLPGIGRLAGHRARHAAGERQHRKQHVMLGDDEVVHQAGIGRLETFEARHRARRIDGSEGHSRGKRSRRVVAEEHHLAGDRIDLGMGRERPSSRRHSGCSRASSACRARSRSADGLPQRQQAAGVEDDVGVGDAAVLRHRGGRVGQPAAEAAEQRAARVMFGLPFGGANPAVAVVARPFSR